MRQGATRVRIWLRRVGVLVVGAAVGLSLLALGTDAARAEGLNFGCETVDDQQPVLGNAQYKQTELSDINLEFDGTVLPQNLSVQHTYDELKFSVYPFMPSFAAQQWYPVDFNADAQPDMWFSFRLRDVAQGTGIDDLLGTNFDLPFDTTAPPNPNQPWNTEPTHEFNGIELIVRKAQNGLQFDYADIEIGFGVELTDTDDNVTSTWVNVQMESPHPGSPILGVFPDEARLTFGFKPRHTPEGNDGYWAIDLDTDYPTNINTAQQRPQMRFGLDVTETTNNSQNALVDVGALFDHGPEHFALGTNELCKYDPEPGFRSRGQISWNRPASQGLDDFGDNHLWLEVLAGEGEGVNGVDELNIDLSIDKLSETFDWVLRPDAMQFLRSPETVMDVDINDVTEASIDPEIEAAHPGVVHMQEPFIMNGTIDDLPERTVIVVDDPDGGTTSEYGLDFCPTDDPGVDDLPFTPCGGAPEWPKHARIVLQDFFDGDTTVADGIPDPPAPGTESYVLYGTNDGVDPETELLADCAGAECNTPMRSAFRFSAELDTPRRGGLVIEKTPTAPDGPTTEMYLDAELSNAQTTHAIVHVDDRTSRVDEKANDDSLIHVDGVVTDLPEKLNVDIESSPVEPVAFTFQAAKPMTRIDGEAFVQLSDEATPNSPDDPAHLRTQFELTGPVPKDVTFAWRDETTSYAGIDTDREVDIDYAASGPIWIKMGAIYATLTQRQNDARTRVWTHSNLPEKIDVSWHEDLWEEELADLVVQSCDSPANCDNRIDAIVVSGPIPHEPCDPRDARRRDRRDRRPEEKPGDDADARRDAEARRGNVRAGTDSGAKRADIAARGASVAEDTARRLASLARDKRVFPVARVAARFVAEAVRGDLPDLKRPDIGVGGPGDRPGDTPPEKPDRPEPPDRPDPDDDPCKDEDGNNTTPLIDESNLLVPPPMPDVTDWVNNTNLGHPEFTSIGREGEGIKVIELSKEWGVEAHLRNIARVHAQGSDDTKVCVQSKPTGRPFIVNAYLDPGKAPDEDVAPGDLYVDAILTKLSRNLGVRLAEDGGDRKDPWLYATTEDCETMNVPGAIGTQGRKEIAQAPHIDAIVRHSTGWGTLNMLGKKAGQNAWAQESIVPDPGPRPNLDPGLIARFLSWDKSLDPSPDGSTSAMQFRITQPVPKHLVVFEPVEWRCYNLDQFLIEECHALHHYEQDETRAYLLHYESSLPDLGPLDGVVRMIGGDPHKQQRLIFQVDEVPGKLEGWARLITNRRFPNIFLDADIEASKPIGDVTVQFRDELDPARYGQFGEPVFDTEIPNYSAIVRNIPDKLALGAEIFLGHEQSAFDDAVTPAPDSEYCDDIGYTPAYEETELGYLHAELDLADDVEQVELLVNTMNTQDRYPGGTDADHAGIVLKGRDGDGNKAEFDRGRVNARLNGLVVDEEQHTNDGGIQIGDNDVLICIDADLPLFAEFEDLSQIKVGIDQAVITEGHLASEDKSTTHNVEYQIRERNLSGAAPGFGFNDVINNGAFIRQRYSEFDPHHIGHWVFNDQPNQYSGMRLLNADRCRAEVDVCYIHEDHAGMPLNEYNYFDVENVFPTSNPKAQYTVGNHVYGEAYIDLIWSGPARQAMFNRDTDPGIIGMPGSEFYFAVVGDMDPVRAVYDVAMPHKITKQDGSVSAEQQFTCPNWPFPQETFHSSGARNTDGTTYGIEITCDSSIANLRNYQARLVAEYPNGDTRWKALTTFGDEDAAFINFDFDYPANMNFTCWKCVFDYTITPDPEQGGVTVVTTVSESGEPGADTWTVTEYFDASGIPGRAREITAATSDGPNHGDAYGWIVDEELPEVTLDACAHSIWACQPPAAGATRVWTLGDGTVLVDPSSSVTHEYPEQGEYRAQVIEFGGSGPDRRFVFDVHVQPQP